MTCEISKDINVEDRGEEKLSPCCTLFSCFFVNLIRYVGNCYKCIGVLTKFVKFFCYISFVKRYMTFYYKKINLLIRKVDCCRVGAWMGGGRRIVGVCGARRGSGVDGGGKWGSGADGSLEMEGWEREEIPKWEEKGEVS